MNPLPQRHPILTMPGVVVAHQAMAGDFYHLIIDAPAIAKIALPGQFVHLVCAADLTLRRPFSIMRSDPNSGRLELLYRVVGKGTTQMSHWLPGHPIDLLGPLGKPFSLDPLPGQAMLIAGGVGIAPLIFLAEGAAATGIATTILLGVELALPFPWRADLASDSVPTLWQPWFHLFQTLTDQGIRLQLASRIQQPGVYPGLVTELAHESLTVLSPSSRNQTVLFTCGPAPMMMAVANLAKGWHLSGQAALEAHMACGYGGCAGCVVPIRHAPGAAEWEYLRACHDGPVFALDQVAWEHYHA